MKIKENKYNKQLTKQYTKNTLNKYSIHIFEKGFEGLNDHEKKVLYEYLQRHQKNI